MKDVFGIIDEEIKEKELELDIIKNFRKFGLPIIAIVATKKPMITVRSEYSTLESLKLILHEFTPIVDPKTKAENWDKACIVYNRGCTKSDRPIDVDDYICVHTEEYEIHLKLNSKYHNIESTHTPAKSNERNLNYNRYLNRNKAELNIDHEARHWMSYEDPRRETFTKEFNTGEKKVYFRKWLEPDEIIEIFKPLFK